MPIVIPSRIPGEVCYRSERATSLQEAILEADERGISLAGAILAGIDLPGAELRGVNLAEVNLAHTNLSGADLAEAKLSRAWLIGAKLSGARLTRANLFQAQAATADLSRARLANACLIKAWLANVNFSGADLTGANLAGADFFQADLTGADLTGTHLSWTELSREQLDSADLTRIHEDIKCILSACPGEVAALRAALEAGQINGTCYNGECCCLVGTLAKARGVPYGSLVGVQPDSNRPAERWFLALQPGHTPRYNPIAAITADWIDEWLKQHKGA